MLLSLSPTLSCKRGSGAYRVGYPGGIRFQFPISFYPSELFRFGGGKRKKKPVPPLEAFYKRRIQPSFEQESFLAEAAWLRDFLGPVEDPCADAASAFFYLVCRDFSIHTGPVSLSQLAGEEQDRDASLDAVISPTQTLSFQGGTRDDLLVLLASLLHAAGSSVGVGREKDGRLLLLIPCGPEGCVLRLVIEELSLDGWEGGAKLLAPFREEELLDLYWFPEPPLAEAVERPERQELRGELEEVLRGWCAGTGTGDLKRRICEAMPGGAS